jgi:hypothetical protein
MKYYSQFFVIAIVIIGVSCCSFCLTAVISTELSGNKKLTTEQQQGNEVEDSSLPTTTESLPEFPDVEAFPEGSRSIERNLSQLLSQLRSARHSSFNSDPEAKEFVDNERRRRREKSST